MEYRIRRATEKDFPNIISLVRYVHDHMSDPSLFAYEGQDETWLWKQKEEGGYGIVAEAVENDANGTAPERGIVAASFVRFPGDDDEGLGRDAGLAEENIPFVSYIEFAVVHPEHRGHHLEYEMLRFAEKQPERKLRPYVFATVSPDNVASLRSLQKAGFSVKCTKEKYGGLLRHIVQYELQQEY